MLVDMVHDNHGEPPFKTRYRDPALLKTYGYDGIVIPDALAVAPLVHSGTQTHTHPARYNSAAELESTIRQRVEQALAADMNVFFYGDAFLLPRHLIEARPADFLCDDATGRLCPGQPAVYEAHQQLVASLFQRYPTTAGLIMRSGEVYPESLPHMTGNAITEANCPRCRPIAAPERIRKFVGAMARTVVEKLGKHYIHRAWQRSKYGETSIHDDPTLYQQVVNGLPASNLLAFSFKFTRGDFLQGRPANPVIASDSRPKWIEFQCEREFEGKGAFPNFQLPLWETFLKLEPFTVDHNHASFWGWSRGTGWGGPYLQREEWIDANVFALAARYKNPAEPPREIAQRWAESAFAVPAQSPAAGIIADILMSSAPTLGKLLYVSALQAKAASNGAMSPWLRDDLLDVEAVWNSAGLVVDLNAADAACDEKRCALSCVQQMRKSFEAIAPELPNKSQAAQLINTLISYTSFAGTLTHLFNGFVRTLQWQRGGGNNAQLAAAATDHLQNAQAQWQHHTQRHAMLPGSPSVFNENTLWDRSNACLEKLAGY